MFSHEVRNVFSDDDWKLYEQWLNGYFFGGLNHAEIILENMSTDDCQVTSVSFLSADRNDAHYEHFEDIWAKYEKLTKQSGNDCYEKYIKYMADYFDVEVTFV